MVPGDQTSGRNSSREVTIVSDISQPAVGPIPGVLAAPPQISVAAFGDSLMWGQGLARNKTFAQMATTGFSQLAGGKPAKIVYANARSGAKIRARGEERHDFADVYPHLFSGGVIDPARIAFEAGLNESPATGLYGEVPATFPTVRSQVMMLPDALGRTVDVALVDGGVNDMAPEDVINPELHSGSNFVGAFDGLIRSICFDDVTDLLIRVRTKCPNAVILYFGFFRPLSFKSSTAQISALLKHELNDDFGWWLNSVLNLTDVNRVIHDGLTRSEWMLGRFTYWTRQAVAELNRNSSRRGPGILYVPSGFGDDNSAFCRNPFLWQDYQPPTGDDAEAKRIRECPRANRLSELRGLHAAATLLTAGFVTSGGQTVSVTALSELARKTERLINGPEPLKEAMRDVAGGNQSSVDDMQRLLAREIGRIQRALIASVSHPNNNGARSYADSAIRRFRQWHDVEQRIAKEALAGPAAVPGPPTLSDDLRRYGLRGSGPVQADAGHLDVDSLAVIVETDETSPPVFVPSVFLIINTKDGTRAKRLDFQLTFPYYIKPLTGPGPSRWLIRKLVPHFEPGEKNRLTIDTGGTLRLTSITSAALLIGPDPVPTSPPGIPRTHGREWHPLSAILEVNGRAVATVTPAAGTKLRIGDRLDFDWPAPTSAKPVVVRPVAVRRTR
jgi:hypothetical protein